MLAIAWLTLVVIGCVAAPLLAPYNPLEQNLLEVLKGPSGAHWLGTDSLGRDILSRLMYGGQQTLAGVAIAIAVYVVIGVTVGITAGYLGGWVDRLSIALVNIALAMPPLIILLVVLSVFRNNTLIAMFLFGLIASPIMVLLVRSASSTLRQELFVDAARVSGLNAPWIIAKHVLPRLTGLIIVQAAVFGANAVVIESALSFLGFGEQPPHPTWGNMVAEAANNISLNSFMLYPTGGVIALTALALGVIGDTLRDRAVGSWTGSMLAVDVRKPAAQPSGPGTALLAVRDLGAGYLQDEGSITEVVRDVSFEVGRGECVGLVGESGSGKSTVAYSLLGLRSGGLRVTSGEVLFGGEDLLTLSGRQLARFRGKRIAYVAQEPTVALDPNFRVGHLLGEAVRRNSTLKTKEEIGERVRELLTRVELRDTAAVVSKFPFELSGGMAQRVSIAFALAGEPELLIADEPTTALDVTVQAGILGLLLKLKAETGMAILIVTHDWGVVADVCDRVLVMYKGQLVEGAPVGEIFHSPRHEYTKMLLAANPHGADPDHDLPTVNLPAAAPGTVPANGQPDSIGSAS